MKTIYLSLLTVLYSFNVNAQDTINVLFIGNSITYFNNMPQTFEAIANSKDDFTNVTMYAPGGTGFLNHVNDPNVYNHFRQGNWDYVILQPGSNESPGYSEPINSTLTRARKLQDSILDYNPCAKILYYEISYGVWGNTAADLMTYNNTMDLIRANLEYLVDSTELFFAPAGETMRAAWNSNQAVMLWGGNGDIHPNTLGSYMIACTFYSSIFQKPSFGSNIVNSLSPTEASYYQKLADSIVLNHFSDWRINTYNSYTDFNYSINQASITFNSTSQNIDSLIWDFGDGNTSNLPLVTHVYNQNDLYNVKLTTYKNGCTEEIIKTVDLLSLGLDVNSSFQKVKVYPNPFSNKIIIENYTDTDIFMFNLLGQDLTNSISVTKTTQHSIEINTTNLPKGAYILKSKTFSNIIYKQ